MRLASLFALTLAALLTLAVPRARAADILTVADIEKAASLSGVRTVPKDYGKGAGGELNFAGSDGKLVAMVMIQSGSMYANWKQRFGASAEPLSGLGDEAFRTKPGAMINYVVFRKGSHSIWIQSMGNKPNGAQTFSAAQLTDLAKLAAGRL